MHAFDVLGDPVRRRVLEQLATGERASGEVVEVIHREFGITQAAVSQHLKVLRDNGFATVRVAGARRIYALDPTPLRQVDAWLEPFRQFLEAAARRTRGRDRAWQAASRSKKMGALLAMTLSGPHDLNSETMA